MTNTQTKICPDCAETVLAAARVCKHCTYRFDQGDEDEPFDLAEAPPIPKPKRRVWPYLLGAAGVAVIAAGAQTSPPEREAPIARLAPSRDAQDFSYIRRTQRALSGRLKDPDSAQFGEGYVSRKSGSPVVCGSVNARNAFGGYSGASRYVGAGDAGTFLETEVPDFADLWKRMC